MIEERTYDFAFEDLAEARKLRDMNLLRRKITSQVR